MDELSDLRKEYRQRRLLETEADTDAMGQFKRWWQEARTSGLEEPNAMTLATASPDGLPSARIVLLKGIDKGGFEFFTNYQSFKGQQLSANPRACLVFFWKEMERQIRITGLVEKIDGHSSDAYFNSRPEGSRLGASVSPQSRVIESSEWLHEKMDELQRSLQGQSPLRPPFWGGYLLRPVTIEFWQGRPNRLHDRLNYTLTESRGWAIERLAP